MSFALGDHLADVPYVALGHLTCGHADVPCVCVADVRWGAQLADVRTCLAFVLLTCVGAPNLCTCLVLRLGAQLADGSCVAFGCPSFGRALRCVGAPNLGGAVLKSLPPSQNLFLSILQLVFYPSAPLCGRFRCGSVFRLGAHLADVPCVAFGRPSCRLAIRCIGVPNLGEVVLKSLPPSQNLFLSILQLFFLPSAPL
jgi:hypothetical protein